MLEKLFRKSLESLEKEAVPEGANLYQAGEILIRVRVPGMDSKGKRTSVELDLGMEKAALDRKLRKGGLNSLFYFAEDFPEDLLQTAWDKLWKDRHEGEQPVRTLELLEDFQPDYSQAELVHLKIGLKSRNSQKTRYSHE